MTRSIVLFEILKALIVHMESPVPTGYSYRPRYLVVITQHKCGTWAWWMGLN